MRTISPSLSISLSLFPVLQKAFNSFDREKTGSISSDMVAEILRLMGQPFNSKILEEMIEEVDEDSKYPVGWGENEGYFYHNKTHTHTDCAQSRARLSSPSS